MKLILILVFFFSKFIQPNITLEELDFIRQISDSNSISIVSSGTKYCEEFFKQNRIYKPDSKVYAIPIEKYDCKPENICFLSSNTWDVSGGGVFGYNAIWVNRFNKVFDKLSYKPKFVIKNLKELLKII